LRHRTFTALLATVLTVTLAWILRSPHRAVLDWDEVSYVTAARLGWWPNAWDRGSLSPGALLAFIQAKAQHQAPRLPEGYEEDLDPLLLRNLHPPFIVFLEVPFAWSMDEPVLRLGQLLGGWTLLGALLLAHRWTSSRPTRMGLVTVGVLGLWAGRLLFRSIQCHGWMTIWTLASVVALGQWLHKRERAWGVASSVFLALTVVTLHTGLVVLAGAIVAVLVLGRLDRRARVRWREAAMGGSIVLSVVLVLWPGSVAKLSLLRSFAQYAYLMRIGKEWAGSRALLCQNSLALLPLLVLLPGLSWWVCARQRSAVARWGPAFLIGVLYAIPVVPHMVTPTYLLPALGSLIPLVGWLVDAQPTRWRTRVVGGATCALVALSWWGTPIAKGEDAAYREDLLWLESALRDHETLADGAHILRHYLGPDYRIRTLWVTYEGDALLLRERGEYRPLTTQDTGGRFVLIEARRPGFPATAQRISALAGCPLAVRRTVLLFDCSNTKTGRETTSGSLPSHEHSGVGWGSQQHRQCNPASAGARVWPATALGCARRLSAPRFTAGITSQTAVCSGWRVATASPEGGQPRRRSPASPGQAPMPTAASSARAGRMGVRRRAPPSASTTSTLRHAKYAIVNSAGSRTSVRHSG
jgi:hypothetical protein